MRKEMITLLCVVGMMLWGVTAANATDIVWNIVTTTDAAIVGHGPGPDKLLGTGDDTTLAVEKANCNFNPAFNCQTSGTPAFGSYSLIALELDDTMLASCRGGPHSGNKGCVCANGTTPCTLGGSECGTGCPAPNCCGDGGLCLSCSQNEGSPDPPDTISYMAYHNVLNNPDGTIDQCQSQNAGGTNFEITAMDIGTSESITGLGPGCLELTPGGTYLGTPCGLSENVNMTISVDFSVFGCALAGGSVPNITMRGSLKTVVGSGATGSALVGYSGPQVQAIMDNLPTGATYLLLLKGTTTVPGTSDAPCLRNASVTSVVVAYTDTTDISCPASSCP